jgi:hypothetical protein
MGCLNPTLIFDCRDKQLPLLAGRYRGLGRRGDEPVQELGGEGQGVLAIHPRMGLKISCKPG